MSYKPADPYTAKLNLRITPTLKAELEAEAWEEQRTVGDYVRGLLTRRGKWARTVGTAGGYDLHGAPANPPKKGDIDGNS